MDTLSLILIALAGIFIICIAKHGFIMGSIKTIEWVIIILGIVLVISIGPDIWKVMTS